MRNSSIRTSTVLYSTSTEGFYVLQVQHTWTTLAAPIAKGQLKDDQRTKYSTSTLVVLYYYVYY
jgi:hypothetical protein